MNKLKIPTRLETDRTLLKKLSIASLEDRFKVYSSNRDFLEEKFVEISPDYNRDMEIKNIRHSQKAWREGYQFDYNIYDKESNKFMGTFSLMLRDDKAKIFEFGYWIGEEFSNKGFMSEIVECVTNVLFDEIKVNKIIISPRDDNTPSIKICEKLGFVLEAKSFQTELFKGQLVNYLYFVKFANNNIQQTVKQNEKVLKKLYGLR